MSDNTREYLDRVMGITGAREIDLVVILDTIDHVEDMHRLHPDSENELILDELQDMLCDYE